MNHITSNPMYHAGAIDCEGYAAEYAICYRRALSIPWPAAWKEAAARVAAYSTAALRDQATAYLGPKPKTRDLAAYLTGWRDVARQVAEPPREEEN